nr:replication protein A 70 kDa DNA-binding subunit B-like [Ipomoea batatas]
MADGEIRISSSYTATRVLFNYECPKLFAFKDRFLTPIRTISSRSRNTGSGSLKTMSNENITVTSLMAIYDDKKIEEFWVVGEITDIQRDWYFIACANKGCGKKIQEINDQMYCKSCDQQSPDEIIKYKLVIDVLDDEQDGQLILWDNVCSPLLGFTASELKGKYSEEGCMPNEIDGLIGKTMKFMIVTRDDQFKYKGNAAFTVLGVQADEAISNSFKKGEQGNVIRKLAEEKEFNENFGQVFRHRQPPPYAAAVSPRTPVAAVDRGKEDRGKIFAAGTEVSRGRGSAAQVLRYCLAEEGPPPFCPLPSTAEIGREAVALLDDPRQQPPETSKLPSPLFTPDQKRSHANVELLPATWSPLLLGLTVTTKEEKLLPRLPWSAVVERRTGRGRRCLPAGGW